MTRRWTYGHFGPRGLTANEATPEWFFMLIIIIIWILSSGRCFVVVSLFTDFFVMPTDGMHYYS